jgi:peptidoglycan/xylan/chitin deacetylase (PgdA/CDA1 family)
MVHNFLFHRVNPKRDIMWDPMDTALFEKCIKFISKNYEVVLLEDLILSGNYSSKKKIATILFDDGYKDNIEYAAPILEKYKCKASFYIVTDCIEKNTLIWTHVLEHTFQFTNKADIDFQFSFLPESLKVTKLATKQERISYLNKLKPFAKLITHEQRSEILSAVQSDFTDVELPELMMNWEDIAELKNAGHYIGSHTVNHHMLGTMSNHDDIYAELIESGNTIKEKLGYFPATISYPVGSYNDTTIELSKKAGYTIGLAVKQTTFNPQKDNIFEIPRIELYNESWLKTKLRITNLLEEFKTVIRYK